MPIAAASSGTEDGLGPTALGAIAGCGGVAQAATASIKNPLKTRQITGQLQESAAVAVRIRANAVAPARRRSRLRVPS